VQQAQVIGCGAGPVGLVAGLRLARAGIETLVDKSLGSTRTFEPPPFTRSRSLSWCLTKEMW